MLATAMLCYAMVSYSILCYAMDAMLLLCYAMLILNECTFPSSFFLLLLGLSIYLSTSLLFFVVVSKMKPMDGWNTVDSTTYFMDG